MAENSPSETRPRVCTWCGARNESDRRICRACGLPFDREQTPAKSGAKVEHRQNSYTWLLIVLSVVLILTFLGAGGFYWWRQQTQKEAASFRLAEEQRRMAEQRMQREEKLRSIPAVIDKARDHLRNRQFNEGLNVIEELLREKIEHPDLLEVKTDLLNNAGKWHQAYQTLLLRLDQQPRKGYLYFAAGNLALNLTGHKAALPHYEAAANLDPDNIGFQIAFANVCFKNGLIDQGSSIFLKLIASNPDCRMCWYNYAHGLFDAGKMQDGVGIFRVAVEKFPEDSRHHFDLALLLDAWGKIANDEAKSLEAAQHYRKSLELRPSPNSIAARRYYQITGQHVPPELETKSGAEEVPLSVAGKVNIVLARINGVEGQFILDTGASYTCVYQDVAAKYQLKPSRHTTQVTTANGVVQVPITYSDVEVGRHKLPRSQVLLLPQRAQKDVTDGLLGMDFLEKFDWQLKTDVQRLTLRGYSDKY